MAKSKESVTNSEPLTENPQDSTASQERNPASNNGGRSLEQAMAENERKADEIAELRSQLESVKAEKEERLAELREQVTLTQEQKNEMVTLEDQIASIKRDPRSKAWLKVNEESSARVARSEVNQFAAELTEEYVQELSEKEKIPYEKFEREIVKYMRIVDPQASLSTYKRAKEAYKALKRDQVLSEKEKKLADLEQKYKESGSQSSSGSSKSPKEILEESKKSDKGLQEYLKIIAGGQEEMLTRK